MLVLANQFHPVCCALLEIFLHGAVLLLLVVELSSWGLNDTRSMNRALFGDRGTKALHVDFGLYLTNRSSYLYGRSQDVEIYNRMINKSLLPPIVKQNCCHFFSPFFL